MLRLSPSPGEKPRDAKPKRSHHSSSFASSPGIAADQLLWTWNTPGRELVANGMFIENVDDDLAYPIEAGDDTDEDDLIALIDADRGVAVDDRYIDEHMFADAPTEEIPKTADTDDDIVIEVEEDEDDPPSTIGEWMCPEVLIRIGWGKNWKPFGATAK